MKNRDVFIGLLLIGSVCTGFVSCATIFSGTKAEVVLNGNIDEPVDIQTDYKLYTRQVLPTTVQVKRGKKASKIEMSSANYDFNDILVSKDVNGWLWGNLAFGGIPGFIIDFADGAAWKPAEGNFYVNATKKINSQTESASSRSMIIGNPSNGTMNIQDDDADEAVQHVSHSHTESSGSSFSEFLEDYIARWEEKGEFETTEQWQKRVSDGNINEMLPELSLMAKKQYIAEEEARIQSTVRLGMYDADNEIFELISDTKTIYVDVPLSVAPQFKENWEKVEKRFEYDVVDDRVSIKSASFIYEGKEFRTIKVVKEQSLQLGLSHTNTDVDKGTSRLSSSEDLSIHESTDVYSNNTSKKAYTLSEDVNPANAAAFLGGAMGYSMVSTFDNKNDLIRLNKDCIYYLNCENPDNLMYVEGLFNKYIRNNGIKTIDNIEHADAIITGHSIDVEGGLLFYLTVTDMNGTLLWMSKTDEAKKANFKRSVKSVVKYSCRNLAKAFNSAVELPVSSPLHSMYDRVAHSYHSGVELPDYSAALRLYQAEDYKAAEKCLDKVIDSYPYFAEAYYLRSITNCKIRDINEGKRDMMYFHELSPFDERFDEGCKYVYYEIALRAERRARNAQITANIMGAVAGAATGVAATVNNSKMTTRTAPVVNTPSSVRSATTTPKTQICSICHGTGKNPSPSTVAQYGQITYQYCDICKKTGTPHYHKVCFKCKGKGYANY